MGALEIFERRAVDACDAAGLDVAQETSMAFRVAAEALSATCGDIDEAQHGLAMRCISDIL